MLTGWNEDDISGFSTFRAATNIWGGGTTIGQYAARGTITLLNYDLICL